jgi:hypothetical protein
MLFEKIELSGRRFGRLVVRAYAGAKRWDCVCDCGSHTVVWGGHLRRGETKSCGCLHRELAKACATKHGMYGTREYRSWQGMKQRCCNPEHVAYESYGGRGITVCEEWRLSFEAFFADMLERPPGTSLDRINNDGNYEPGNCCWSDAKQQAENRRPQRARTAVKRRQAEPAHLADVPF